MKKKKPYILKRIQCMVCAQCVIMVCELILMLLIQNDAAMRFIVKIALAEIFFFAAVFYYRVSKPMYKMNKVFQAFADKYTVQDIFSLNYALNEPHEAMLERLNIILDNKQMLQSSKKQAEYLALQNQINPHFLYNTLEGIRSEALVGGLPSVAEMAEALAKFFRYTISNINALVTVEDELDNVKNYCLIQKFRFGEKIKLDIKYEDEDEQEIIAVKIPKLILQPIVENAIRHGIEPLIGTGVIVIRLQVVGSRLIIFISDNGVGMETKMLRQLNNHLKGPQIDAEQQYSRDGGIAMSNVNTRIKLIFGDEYGIHFYSTSGIGTDVEITLPLKGTGELDEERSIAH